MATAQRLLFASYHRYFDPSSGAAWATRDLLELLARRDWQCRVLSAAQFDYEEGGSLRQLLADDHVPFVEKPAPAGTIPFSVFHLAIGNVPVTIFDAPGVRPFRPPSREKGHIFLALYDKLLDQFQPDVLLTYGSHWLAQEIIARAKPKCSHHAIRRSLHRFHEN